MDIFDQKKVLGSMQIIVDTREHYTDKARRRFERFRCPYYLETLSYGDYAYNARLPGGKLLYETAHPVKPSVCIERKESLDELAKCLGTRRDRFLRELQRAKDAGAKVYLIVENAT